MKPCASCRKETQEGHPWCKECVDLMDQEHSPPQWRELRDMVRVINFLVDKIEEIEARLKAIEPE